MNLAALGRGFIQRVLPRFSRGERRMIVRELAKDQGAGITPDIPANPPQGRKSRPGPFGNYWDVVGSKLASRMINTDSLSVAHYREMVEEDETVSAAIDFITLSVMDQFGVYENPASKRAVRYERELWERCQTSLAEYLREALTATWAGYSVGERCYIYEDGKLWLDQLPVLDPDGLTFLMETDENSRRYGMVSGVTRDGLALGKPIEIESLSIYTHNGLFGDPYGRSRCKSMFPNWVSKKALFLQWAKTLERYGSPGSYAKAANLNNPEKHWLTGKDSTRGVNLMDMLSNLHNSGTGVVPPDVDLILIEAKAALGEDFERAQNHFNKCILRGLLIPALLFEPTDIGSFALGDKHFEIFLASVRNVALELNRVVIRYIIAPLLRWNFGRGIPVGEYKAQRIQTAEMKLWSEIFFSMANAGFIRKDLLEDANLVREKLNAPLWKDLPPPAPNPVADQAGAGENLPNGQAPDGRGGADPGHPMATPQAPGRPQGRPVIRPRKKAA